MQYLRGSKPRFRWRKQVLLLAFWNVPPSSQPLSLRVSNFVCCHLDHLESPGLRLSDWKEAQKKSGPCLSSPQGSRSTVVDHLQCPDFPKEPRPRQPALAGVTLLPVLLPPALALPLRSPGIRNKMPLFSISALKRTGPCSVLLKLTGPGSLHCSSQGLASAPLPSHPP